MTAAAIIAAVFLAGGLALLAAAAWSASIVRWDRTAEYGEPANGLRR